MFDQLSESAPERSGAEREAERSKIFESAPERSGARSKCSGARSGALFFCQVTALLLSATIILSIEWHMGMIRRLILSFMVNALLI